MRALLASCLAVTVTAVITTAHAADPLVTVPYTVDRDARVSLALYDSAGRMVRTLLTGAPRLPGSYVATWDGRDRYGAPLPAGTYRWKRAISGGLQAEFICQIGQNPDPVWASGVGNHGGAGTIAVDGTGVYLMSSFDEGTHSAVKTDFAGRYQWTVDNWWKSAWAERGHASCIIGTDLYRLVGDGTMYGHRTASGRLFTDDTYSPAPWNLRWAGDGEDQHYSTVHGMDLDGDRAASLLVVSYRAKNGIRWFAAGNGAPVDQATITAPVSVSCASDGTVHVISEGAVKSLTRTDKTPRVVIPASALASPWRISVDPATGDIFVAENSAKAGGAPRHQVKKFSRTGTLIRTFGRAEGRQQGTYVNTDVRGIVDIAADGQGGFLVSEGLEAPRRTARFAADGSVRREWFGAQFYGVSAVPEPGDPTHVWFMANGSGLVRARIDLTARTWRVLETYTIDIGRSLLGGTGRINRAFRRGGKLYLASGSHDALWLAIYDATAKRLRVTNTGGAAWKDNQWHIPAELRPEDGSKPYGYRWSDLDDDGVATRDEMIFGGITGGWVDPATLSIFTTPMATAFDPGPRIVPSRITAGGTPVYPASSSERVPRWTEEPGEAYWPYDFRKDAAGNLYGCFADSFPGWENHGVWYFNSNSGIDRLIKWDASGQPLWSVGRHSPDPDSAIGSTAMPRSIAGITKGCIVWSDSSDEEYIGSSVWSTDGLWVGEIPKLPADRGHEWMYNANGNEYSTYNIATDDVTGEVLFFGQTAMGGAPVYRITGWNGIVQASGTVTLGSAPAALAATGTGLSAAYFNNTTLSGAAALTRTDADVWFNWSNGSPGTGVNADNFSCRWTGQVLARSNGETRFTIEGNKPWQDGGDPAWVKLWVDGRLLVDGQSGWSDGRIVLRAGERYDVKLEAAFTTGGAAIHLCWENDENDRRRVQQRYLFPSGSAGQRYPGGLLAHWRFNDAGGTSATDASGNGRTATLSGTTWQSDGVIRGSVGFSGGSGNAAAQVGVPATGSTVSLWFRTKQANGGLWSQVDGAGGADRHVFLSGGKLGARLSDGISETITTVTSFNDDRWHHLVHVVGGPEGGQRLYVDGLLRAAGALGRSGLGGQNGVLIGRSSASGSATFSGRIDEVRAYGVALGARAVRDDLYRREHGLIAWLPFDEGSGHSAGSAVGAQIRGWLSGASDWSTGRHGGGVTLAPSGQFAPALLYVDHEIRVPASDTTLAFWFKTTASSTDLLYADRDSSYNNRWVTNGIGLDQGRVRVWQPDGATIDSPTAFNDGQWHHVATTIGGASGALKLYVDGVLRATGTATAFRESTRLGLDLAPSAMVAYDDLRLYGRALAADEIAALKDLVPLPVAAPPATPAAPAIAGNGTAAPVASGTGVVGTTINVRLDGVVVASVPVAGDGTWTHSFLHLSPGDRQLTVTAANLAGTSAPTAAQTLTIAGGGGGGGAGVPPTTPAAPQVGGAPSRPTLSGGTEAGASVQIRDHGVVVGTVTAADDGAWSWTPATDLTPGEHRFTVVARNSVGASGTSPGVTIVVPGTGSGSGADGGGGGSSAACGLGAATSLMTLLVMTCLHAWRARH